MHLWSWILFSRIVYRKLLYGRRAMPVVLFAFPEIFIIRHVICFNCRHLKQYSKNVSWILSLLWIWKWCQRGCHDSVCIMTVQKNTNLSSRHLGHSYHFSFDYCKKTVWSEPFKICNFIRKKRIRAKVHRQKDKMCFKLSNWIRGFHCMDSHDSFFLCPPISMKYLQQRDRLTAWNISIIYTKRYGPSAPVCG